MVSYCICEQVKEYSTIKTAYILFEQGKANLSEYLQKLKVMYSNLIKFLKIKFLF